jgi:hypothetical protein
LCAIAASGLCGPPSAREEPLLGNVPDGPVGFSSDSNASKA